MNGPPWNIIRDFRMIKRFLDESQSAEELATLFAIQFTLINFRDSRSSTKRDQGWLPARIYIHNCERIWGLNEWMLSPPGACSNVIRCSSSPRHSWRPYPPHQNWKYKAIALVSNIEMKYAELLIGQTHIELSAVWNHKVCSHNGASSSIFHAALQGVS